MVWSGNCIRGARARAHGLHRRSRPTRQQGHVAIRAIPARVRTSRRSCFARPRSTCTAAVPKCSWRLWRIWAGCTTAWMRMWSGSFRGRSVRTTVSTTSTSSSTLGSRSPRRPGAEHPAGRRGVRDRGADILSRGHLRHMRDAPHVGGRDPPRLGPQRRGAGSLGDHDDLHFTRDVLAHRPRPLKPTRHQRHRSHTCPQPSSTSRMTSSSHAPSSGDDPIATPSSSGCGTNCPCHSTPKLRRHGHQKAARASGR